MKDLNKGNINLHHLSKAELIEMIELLLPLVPLVQKLEEKIKRLENLNSRNSSLPPSRDRKDVKLKTRSLRTKSGKKSGGQKGHKGSTLKLSETIDEYVDYKVEKCEHCCEDIAHCETSILERKQVLDIPAIRMLVTEHRRWRHHCPRCEKWTHAQYGTNLKSGPVARYGDQIKNQICYLHVRQLIPYQRLTEMIATQYGQKISQGSIDNILTAKAKEAAPAYEQIIKHIEKSPVVGVDESGCTVNGEKTWAWTWVTPRYSLFHISENRGYKTVMDFFPDGFKHAVLISDCWRTHLKTRAKGHQICIPHIRRECQGLIDFFGSKWAKQLDLVLQEITLVCRSKRIPIKTKQWIEDRLDKLLAGKLTRSHKKSHCT